MADELNSAAEGLSLPLPLPRQEPDDGGSGGDATPAGMCTPSAPGAAPRFSSIPLHPQRWTEDQVRAWWDRRTKRKKDIEKLPKGTDGRNIMRWNQTRFEQMCGGNNALAIALYQDLRNEVSRFEQFRKTGVVPEPCRVRTDVDDRPSRRQLGDVKAASPGPSANLRHTMPAQVKSELKFNPARRTDATASPSAPRRPPTAPGGAGTPSSKPKAAAAAPRPKTAPSPAAKGRTPSTGASVRKKSATRTTRVGSKNSAGSAGSASLPVHHASTSEVVFETTLKPQTSELFTERVQECRMIPRRSLEMEDLGDETLAQISSPKKDDAKDMFLEESLKSPSRVSVDDTEMFRKPKTAKAGLGMAIANKENEEDEPNRQMFNKRELRKRHKVLFDQQICRWRDRRLAEALTAGPEGNACRVRVCVRKRPLFSHEEAAEEFDVVTVRSGFQVVVHNCLTKADLRSLFISHMGFQFSRAFDEVTNDDEVYEHCAAPAVEHMLGGCVASLFMFGQTGSGKTHTMSGLIRRASVHLFKGEQYEAESEGFTLTAFEIAGKNMRDLLDTGSSPKELKVMEDKGGRTRVLGVRVCDVLGSDDLMQLIENAQANRATRATQVNETSSRSHAVYRIGRPGREGSTLTLVDCAGSERREDTTQHDARSRRDAAEINSTIFALKECFRVMRSSKGQQPPYRESLLTRVLAESFSSEQALIVAIGTVSPSATDTEHSIGTLRALQQLQGTQMVFDEREDVVKPKVVELHPRTWSETEVRQWVEGALGGKAKMYAASLTKGTDGKNFVRWPLQRFTQLCGGDEDLGSKLYQDLRVKIRSAGVVEA